jgi:UTP--glucose-1-phosphate uridylyltransferase
MLLYCRSLIEVRSGKSFIDIIVEHIEVLNFRYGTNILLILATSDNTDEPLSQAVRKYSNSHLEIVTFNQTEYTREVWPVRSKLGEDGRYLTNNGDLFAALAFSGKLEELIAQGKEILFIADSENLGATVDLSILRILTYVKYLN